MCVFLCSFQEPLEWWSKWYVTTLPSDRWIITFKGSAILIRDQYEWAFSCGGGSEKSQNIIKSSSSWLPRQGGSNGVHYVWDCKNIFLGRQKGLEGSAKGPTCIQTQKKCKLAQKNANHHGFLCWLQCLKQLNQKSKFKIWKNQNKDRKRT